MTDEPTRPDTASEQPSDGPSPEVAPIHPDRGSEPPEAPSGPSGASAVMDPIAVEVIDFIEAYHTKYGVFPTRVVIETVLDATGKDWTPEYLDDLFASNQYEKSLNARGITLPTQLENSITGLTKRQLAAIAVLNNSRDSRSDVKKLSDLKISPREFAGWMHDKRFTEAMQDSASTLYENSQADAHMSLLRKVRSGDLSAIRLYFEMTGRYNPAYENQVNLQQFMSAVIEAIQKHVHDPEILQALAAELQMATVAHGVKINKAPGPVSVQAQSRKELAPINTGKIYF